MAIKPYQRTGLMTQGFQPSQGFALREAQNTQLVLADQLNRMSDFFFKTAGQRAETAGKEYGAGVVPDFEQILEATADLTDDKELNMPSFDENTIYGRAAKKEALLVLENRLTVQATEAFNESVFLANKNGHQPGVLKDGLNGTIRGIVDTVSAVSPSFSKKMEAKLAMTAAGHFQNYRIQYLAASKESMKKTNLDGAEIDLSNLGTVLDSQLQLDNLTLTTDQLIEVRDKLREKYFDKVVLAYSTVSQQQTQMEKWDTKFLNHIQNHIISTLFEDGHATTGTVQKIRRNNPTQNSKINPILNMLSDEQRRSLATALQTDINNEENAQTQEDSRKEKEVENKKNQLTKDFATALYGEVHEPDKASAVVAELALIDPLQASKLESKLAEYEGKRPFSNPTVLKELREKKNLQQLEFDDLFSKEEYLSAKDFNELLLGQQKLEQSQLKMQLDTVAIGLGFNRDLKILTSGEDPTMSDRSVVNEMAVRAGQEYETALADKIEFDAEATVARLVAELGPELKTQVIEQYKQNADSAIKQLLDYLTEEYREQNGITVTLNPEDYQGIYTFALGHIEARMNAGSKLFNDDSDFKTYISKVSRTIKTYLTQINNTDN